jgi:gliding motility-associated lipoprotein GldD
VNNDLARYINDSQTLSLKHITKASGMQEEEINEPEKKVYGFYTFVKGNAASAVQFYLTDSSKHFIRGALYFYAIPNPDSIAPVLTFVEEDVKHLVSTFEWK